jgi:hypothetical protein
MQHQPANAMHERTLLMGRNPWYRGQTRGTSGSELIEITMVAVEHNSTIQILDSFKVL